MLTIADGDVLLDSSGSTELPEIVLDRDTNPRRARVASYSDGYLHFLANLYNDGNWQRDDTGSYSTVLDLRTGSTEALRVRSAAPAANPATLDNLLSLSRDGSLDLMGTGGATIRPLASASATRCISSADAGTTKLTAVTPLPSTSSTLAT